MNLNAEVQKYLNDYAIDRKREIDRNVGLLFQALQRCESPLEQIFLIRIIDWFGASPINVNANEIHFLARALAPGVERFRIRIFSQRNIHIKPRFDPNQKDYRADFLIVLERDESPFESWETTEYFRLVVEVDGHNYHERTKEQAQRDRSRDRYMVKGGYVVFRYTGSEVFRDAESIASEIGEYIYEQATLLAKRHGL